MEKSFQILSLKENLWKPHEGDLFGKLTRLSSQTVFVSNPCRRDKGMEGRSVDFLYTICRYIATIHTDIVEKLTRSVEIVSQKNGHYFLNQHYLYKDRLYLLVRQDLLK